MLLSITMDYYKLKSKGESRRITRDPDPSFYPADPDYLDKDPSEYVMNSHSSGTDNSLTYLWGAHHYKIFYHLILNYVNAKGSI